MQMRSGKKRRSLILNLTSLIDVLFLLLIFFMISTTFLSQPAIKLELPEAENAETVRQTPMVVHVDPSGRVYFNDEPIEPAILGEMLRMKLEDDVEKSVVLKADSRVSHGAVIHILDIIKGAGIRKIVFSTKPEEE